MKAAAGSDSDRPSPPTFAAQRTQPAAEHGGEDDDSVQEGGHTHARATVTTEVVDLTRAPPDGDGDGDGDDGDDDFNVPVRTPPPTPPRYSFEKSMPAVVDRSAVVHQHPQFDFTSASAVPADFRMASDGRLTTADSTNWTDIGVCRDLETASASTALVSRSRPGRLGRGSLGSMYDPELLPNGGGYLEKKVIGSVTVRCPFPCGFLPVMALFWSYVPWALPVLVALHLLWYFVFLRALHLAPTFFLALLTLGLILFELVLKNVFRQRRPKWTGIRGDDGRPRYGMPSSHTLVTQLFLVWYSMQALWVRRHRSGVYVAGALLALSPVVPWARVYNGDHTVAQVCAPMVTCTFLCIGAWFFFHIYIRDWLRDKSSMWVIHMDQQELLYALFTDFLSVDYGKPAEITFFDVWFPHWSFLKIKV